MKYSLIILFISFLAISCQQEEVHLYLGKDYIQFKKKLDSTYSFVVAGSSVKRDTVWLPAFCTGSMGAVDRSYRVQQVIEYKFEERKDGYGNLIDSVLVETKNQAESGVHYVDFDDPGYRNLCKVSSEKVNFRVPVIVFRHLSLKDEDRVLLFEFRNSDKFDVGDSNTKRARLVISDRLIYPEAWSKYTPDESNQGKNMILGNYGKIKHQLLIDVTGKPWDNTFIDSLTVEEMLFYKSMASKELDKINAERAERGEPPLREDPDNPNSVVIFP